ncbi:MAG: glycosyltransferase family 2 protein [Rhodanobacteraceae bacterium]|nr:glycosyltransferase family 2 protein [Rhodanobacteraceae bacterium]
MSRDQIEHGPSSERSTPHSVPAMSGELLSIVVPVYNEESVLPALFDRLEALAGGLDLAVEILLVSDGSTDSTNAQIRAQIDLDPRYHGILLARNFGHQAAVSVGLERASGDFVAVIDGDLQDPPEVIRDLLARVRNDADVAYGVRAKRKEGWFKRSLYATFYRLLRRIANIPIPLDSGDFCCMRRCVVEAMLQLPERNRFIRGLRAWVGFRQVGVSYERSARFAGETHYTWRKLMRLATDGLFGFSTLPVTLMQGLGFIISMVSALVAAVYFGWYLIDSQRFPTGFATLIISMWMLAGLQLLFLGFIGEYLVRTYDESRRRPAAIIAEHLHSVRDL